jgi:hypothetical protein
MGAAEFQGTLTCSSIPDQLHICSLMQIDWHGSWC